MSPDRPTPQGSLDELVDGPLDVHADVRDPYGDSLGDDVDDVDDLDDRLGDHRDHPGDKVHVVVPLRSFVGAKARLADRLDPHERAALARWMADRVVRAASPHPVTVVTSAPEVVGWARAAGLDVVDDPGTLDAAARVGVVRARSLGAARVVVAHGDLPLVASFDAVLDAPAGHVVLVPDRRRDGTPVLVVPTGADLPFAYGPGSYARHLAAAARAGWPVTVVEDPRLGTDVDVPDDLALVPPSVPSP